MVVVVTSTTNRFGDEVVWIGQSLPEKKPKAFDDGLRELLS